MGYNLTNLNATQMLNVTFVSGFSKEDKIVPELVNYTIVSFSETEFIMELNLTHKLYVAKGDK